MLTAFETCVENYGKINCIAVHLSLAVHSLRSASCHVPILLNVLPMMHLISH